MENKIFKVAFAAVETGNVLKNDLTLYLGEGEIYTYFDQVKQAILFGNQMVKEHPEIECWVSNEKDEMVYFKSIKEERFTS